MTGNIVQFHQHNYDLAVAGGTRPIFTDATIEIISVENRLAAQFWFADTAWCVKENPWFEGYLECGPLIFMRSHLRSRDYLLAPAHGEFRNVRNRRTSLRHFVQQHQSIGNVLISMGVYCHLLETKGDWGDRIYFCPSRDSPYHLTNRARVSADEDISK